VILDAHGRCLAAGIKDAVAKPLIESVAIVTSATRLDGEDPGRAFLDRLDAALDTIQEGDRP
jgi:hypothetical protein